MKSLDSVERPMVVNRPLKRELKPPASAYRMIKKNHVGKAITSSRCKGPMGDHTRMLKSKLGKKSGTIAMANKLSRITYFMVTSPQEYNKNLSKSQKDKHKKKRIKHLEQQLRRLKWDS